MASIPVIPLEQKSIGLWYVCTYIDIAVKISIIGPQVEVMSLVEAHLVIFIIHLIKRIHIKRGQLY